MNKLTQHLPGEAQDPTLIISAFITPSGIKLAAVSTETRGMTVHLCDAWWKPRKVMGACPRAEMKEPPKRWHEELRSAHKKTGSILVAELSTNLHEVKA